MEIITFKATTEKGIIQIPPQYLQSVTDHVQVIIVVETTNKTKKPKVTFKALTIDTKNTPFNRNEADEC